MHVTGERTEDGVTRREFDLTVNGERVPGVIWAPEGAKGPRPLVLMGHGGSQHKKIANIAAAARRHARELGYATAAIDAPGHGDRVSKEEAARFAAEIVRRIREGAKTAGNANPGGETPREMTDRAAKALPEWKAALDAVQSFDFVGRAGPVGYWGVSMGTALGLPFAADEPRVTCAVFGLFGMLEGIDAVTHAAANLTIPLQYVVQWDDELVSRDAGLALFNTFGSREKSMHINPGGHTAIPVHERDAWTAFWRRHLGAASSIAGA